MGVSYLYYFHVISRSQIETEGRIDSLLSDLRLVKYQHIQVKSLRKDQTMILRIAIEVLTKSSLIIIDNPFDTFTPSMTVNVNMHILFDL